MNKKALHIATEFLALDFPVKTMRCRMHSFGRYYWREDHHLILLARDVSAQQASKTLWHELCHAVQIERLGAKDWTALYEAQALVLGLPAQALDPRRDLTREEFNAYKKIPLEAEAYEFQHWHSGLPLCR